MNEVEDFLERRGDEIASAIEHEEHMSKLSPWARAMLKLLEPRAPSPRGHLLLDKEYMAILNERRSQ